MINRYKVPKKQWRKWDCFGKFTFNEVYRSLTKDYRSLLPPVAQVLSRQSRRVIAWNAAWVAADSSNRTPNR